MNKPVALAEFPDSKTGRPIGDVARDFKYQPNPNSCYPNGIYNALRELGERHGIGLSFSEKKIKCTVQYTEMLGPKTEIVIPAMNKVLNPYQYVAAERTTSTFGELLAALRDGNRSYPLVGVSPEYYSDVAPRYKSQGTTDRSCCNRPQAR